MRAITGGRVLTASGTLTDADVMIDGGTIMGLVDANSTDGLDATGLIVAPGFVDTHVHGALGANFMMGEADAFDTIAAFLLPRGVTSVLAATASIPRQATPGALSRIAAHVGRRPVGLEVLGIHLEGPFLHPDFRGVHRSDAVRAPNTTEVDELIGALGSALRVVTLAPDTADAAAATSSFTAAGVTVSIGHTGATPAEAHRVISAGATRATHLFNAMPEPTGGGLIDHLLSEDIFVEIIADGHHVAPTRIRALFDTIGAARIAIVSDGSDVTGLPDGPHRRWEGTDVIVRDGSSRTPTGMLAGSVSPLDRSLRVLVEQAQVPLVDALISLTRTPADSIDCQRKGRIAPGADADFVLLSDSLDVIATVADGRVVARQGALV